MRLLFALLLLAATEQNAFAQSPFPQAMPPEAAWGGYAVPAQVPYQPTLDGSPMMAAPGDGGGDWQGYPAAVDQAGQPVILEGSEPFGPPMPLPTNVPAGTGYSITSEP